MFASITTSASITIATGFIGAGSARADVIYETNSPFGGPFGLIGFDVSSEQSVALRFSPGSNFTLDRVSVWFMNNDFSGDTHPLVTITLRTNDAAGGGIPSDEILEQWQFNVSAVGWDPMLEELDSVVHPVLQNDEFYWIVAESDAPGGLDGVWNWAANDSGYMSICNGNPCEWSPPPKTGGAVAAGVIEGTPAVTPGDTNGDGVVDVDDLVAVILAWGDCPKPPKDCPADVDGSGEVDVDDLVMVILNWG
jgi:hypothetical protein